MEKCYVFIEVGTEFQYYLDELRLETVKTRHGRITSSWGKSVRSTFVRSKMQGDQSSGGASLGATGALRHFIFGDQKKKVSGFKKKQFEH
jgi:hypothetical protein